MQQVKMSYTNHLLCRLTEGVEDRELEKQKRYSLLQECVAEMKLSIDHAKDCYAEEVTLDVEMMLVDGCFILELLCRNHLIYSVTMTASTEPQPLPVPESRIEVERSRTIEGILETTTASTEPQLQTMTASTFTEPQLQTMTASTEPQALPVPESRIEVERSHTSEGILGLQTADPIFGNLLTSRDVHHDLLLLENQIPYLVLEKLFPLTVDRIPSGLNRLSLTSYLELYFRKKMRPEGNSTEEEVPSRPANDHYHHILHKVHDGYLPPDQRGMTINYEIMPSATELVYAGVKFVRGTEEDDLFKVKFNKPEGPFWCCRRASFEIPTLVMEDSTESFLRNLIAFEQCRPGVPRHFTSYAILMDMLVDSDKDVQVLEKAGVVRNLLGASEDATNLFNKLCKEIVERGFFFADICNRAHTYRRSFWPKHIAHVRRQYFTSPWRFIAFCLAFCAVGISITQFLRSFSWP